MHWILETVAPSTEPASARARTVLAVPGHVLEEHVAVAGERGEHERDLVVLAVHDGLDVAEQRAGDLGRSAERGGVRSAPLNARHIGHGSRAAREGRLGGGLPGRVLRAVTVRLPNMPRSMWNGTSQT